MSHDTSSLDAGLPSQGIPHDSQCWDTIETPHDGLVKGATGRELFLVARGAPRQPGQPVVIFESGLGMSSAPWAAVQRLLDPRVRSIRYDRAGYGRSPPPPAPAAARAKADKVKEEGSAESLRTASNMAAELLDVLRAAGVGPPYLLAAHSYGGVIAREFVAAAVGDGGTGEEAVVGLVLVDANQENTPRTMRHPHASIQALTRGRNYFDIIGLPQESGFTPEELRHFMSDLAVPTAASTAASENAFALPSCAMLGERKQLETRPLGTRPVTVIRGDTGRDFRRLLDHAAGAKEGTGLLDEDLSRHVKEVNDFLESRFEPFDRGLHIQQLGLSHNSRFVQAQNSGHDVIATEPELVAREVFDVWQGSASALEKGGTIDVRHGTHSPRITTYVS